VKANPYKRKKVILYRFMTWGLRIIVTCLKITFINFRKIKPKDTFISFRKIKPLKIWFTEWHICLY